MVRLRARDRSTAATAAALLDRELGAGLYTAEGLLRDAADPTAGVWVADGTTVAGATLSRLLVPADAAYYERFGPQATGIFGGTVGSFEALAVEPAARRRGLGSQLTAVSLDWMREQGCDTAIAVSWRSGRPGSSVGLFRRLGFREGPTVERFYHAESVRDGWVCPVCRGPCVCPATLFTLALAAWGGSRQVRR